MRKFITLLSAASVSLFAGACTATGVDIGSKSAASPADIAYCQNLVDNYTTYVGSVGGTLGGNSERSGPADLGAKVAIAQCQEGNTGPAIPVLEQKLRDAKVAVPPRTP